MNLKDTIQADRHIFINPDEFGETFEVSMRSGSYPSVRGVFRWIEDSGHTADGVYISEAELHYMNEDMPRPVNNQLLQIDDQRYVVQAVEDRAGLVSIRLKTHGS